MSEEPILTGQHITQAERATRAALDQLLARTGTAFHEWAVLNQAGSNGGEAEQEAIVGRVVSVLRVDPEVVSSTIETLVEAGLATSRDGRLILTADGTARWEQIRDETLALTDRLYGDLSSADLLAARRVLAIATERANAELAGSGATR